MECFNHSISMNGEHDIVTRIYFGRNGPILNYSFRKNWEILRTLQQMFWKDLSPWKSIFQILEPFDGLEVLDLFAGVGTLGFEALSRGASRAVFVEKDRRVFKLFE